MTVRDWVLLVVRATGFALVTATGGWLTIPLTAGIWSVLATGERHREMRLALAASLGWGLLLLWSAGRGDMSRLLAILSGVFPVPGWSFLLLTLAVPALLAWSAGIVAAGTSRLAAVLAAKVRSRRP